MTNDECPLNDEAPMTNKRACRFVIGHSTFDIHWKFGIRHLIAFLEIDGRFE